MECQNGQSANPEHERRAPGWRVRCLKCGFTEPWGKYGVRRWAAGRKWTLGWCSRCRGLHCHAIEKRPDDQPNPPEPSA